MARVKLRCIMGCLGLKSSYREKGLLLFHFFMPVAFGMELFATEVKDSKLFHFSKRPPS